LVALGNRTKTPSTLTCSSVVSRDSVRIALTIAALNDLDILVCDIEGAYLTAKCREKVFIEAGAAFGSEAGKIMIVKMALYGLKSSGAAFRSKLAGVLHDLGYRPAYTDPDVWLKAAVKPCGFEYYEMVLCYVDDVMMVISHKPQGTIEGIQSVFKLKGDKAGSPDMYYLGVTLKQMLLWL
jgi:UDP-N-acetylglucosamine transferase subunit ALG13